MDPINNQGQTTPVFIPPQQEQKPTAKKSGFKIILTAIILIILATAAVLILKNNSVTAPESGPAPITLTPTQAGPFKYFQIDGAAGTGVTGEVFLNGKSVAEFANDGGQISNNEAQDLVKNGQNTIKLVITSVGETTTAVFSDSVIKVALHALNTEDFPSDENRIIYITWNPKAGDQGTISAKNPLVINYSFSVLR